MDIFVNILFSLTGLAALFLGGEGVVRGASRLARIIGVSPIVIGLTVVAFGTSAPEFIVSLIAALKGSSDIALGNIVGSNISNIGLIFGISAIISPFVINLRLAKVTVSFMILSSLVLYFIAWGLEINRIEGGGLFGMLIILITYTYRIAKKEALDIEQKNDQIQGPEYAKWRQVGLIALGLVGLIIGAELLVDSAILVAKALGVSELIIGITAIAVGTSLPELATSIIAAIRKETDIMVGNLIGSNVFNVGILGLVSVIKPIRVEASLLSFELIAVVFFSVLVLPIMATGARANRLEGALLLILYTAFILSLFK